MSENNNNTSVYEIITNRIIELLEKGIIPWKQTWRIEKPMNIFSKHKYSGINFFILNSICNLYKYPHNLWLTFKQATSLKGKVKNNEKGFPVVFWTLLDKKKSSESGKDKKIPFLKYFTAFNYSQCEGLKIDLPAIEESNYSIARCEEIVSGYKNKPIIEFGNFDPCYIPSVDTIKMPLITDFNSSESFYATYFHELIHSTGHESRLKRGLSNLFFGKESYSKEELLAEMGASFLSSICNIESNFTISNSVSYINSWLEVLKNDKKMVIEASSKAQKAVNFITGT